MKINGRIIAQQIFEELKIKLKKLEEKNITPNLAIILVGNDPASKAYVRQKELKANLINAKTTIFNLKSKIQNSELNEVLEELNQDNSTHGIIVQRPLSSHIDSHGISLAIDPKKDVDGFHPDSKFEPPIFMAVMTLLKQINVTPKGKNIVILGKGETGGKPIMQSLKKMGIKPLVIDSKTPNPLSITKNADIIISAVGKPNVVKQEMLKKGAILISIGLHKGTDGKLHGDYNEEEIKDIASFYTPTPGGVGPVNVAMLLKNLIKSSENFNRVRQE